ncbi:zf-HC2 domain-containing protein [Streptomyces sp. HNM0575]|uniref:zf-HC2 domain-containing protein n=1 Tax=Streptomyces sp. HNM0575 TaxID=2716338 RepID=UPI00145D2EF1|nr:zf-HC2 domain-containing protein [Streptomyces sp. HNM0575]NLU71396.1 zf-HC2 domain-containing protein [Streptomyces sp. HNM0575]
MSPEHASMRIIDAYARGDSDIAADEVWALEAHLEKCGACRDRLSAAVTSEAPAVASLVGTVWSELEPRLATAVPTPPRRRWSGRLSAWMTPVMVPWLVMAVSVTLIALLLDVSGVRPGLGDEPLVLLLAPLLPVCGVAASWSRGLDPAYELTASAPRAGLQLVLRRTAAVLAVVIPPLLVGGWATGVGAGQWLLPALAFTSAALALSTVVGVTRACAALVVVWAAVVLAPTLATGRTAFVLQPDGMPVWGLLLALGTGVVVARRGAYSVLGTDR